MARCAAFRLVVAVIAGGLPLAAALAAPVGAGSTRPAPQFRVSGTPCVVSTDPRARAERVTDLVAGRCGRALSTVEDRAPATDEKAEPGPARGDGRTVPRVVLWDDVDPRVTVRRPSARVPAAVSDSRDVETRLCGSVPFAVLSQDVDPRAATGRDPLLPASPHTRRHGSTSIAAAQDHRGDCS